MTLTDLVILLREQHRHASASRQALLDSLRLQPVSGGLNNTYTRMTMERDTFASNSTSGRGPARRARMELNLLLASRG